MILTVIYSYISVCSDNNGSLSYGESAIIVIYFVILGNIHAITVDANFSKVAIVPVGDCVCIC